MDRQHRSRRSFALAGAALLTLAILGPGAGATLGHPAEQAGGACWPGGLPMGALPPATPAWCAELGGGAMTFVQGPNSWVDDFEHGLKMAELGNGYLQFSMGSLNKTVQFRHNDHWMVDVNGVDESPSDGPWNVGGALTRPDRAFRFEDGRLVVEVDAAAGVAEYGGGAWPEVVITTAPAPTTFRRDGTYAYDTFAGYWTLGCRLQSSREPICALFDGTTRGAGEGGRVWEISHFQQGPFAQKSGGHPSHPSSANWRVCRGTDPDTDCRDRFRWELTADTVTISVNGRPYMTHRGAADEGRLPAALLNGEVYVYLGSWIHKPDAETVRFHWDRLAINPAGGPAAPEIPDGHRH